jgi:hypothetical protein
MRRLLCAAFLLLTPAAANAGDTPNPLTQKEIADGWLLLFDGKTTFGWDVEGESAVAKGVLTLGGKKTSIAKLNTQFGSFELAFECRVEGEEAAKLVRRRGGTTNPHNLELAAAGNAAWDTFRLRVEFDPAQETEMDDLDYQSSLKGQIQGKGSGSGFSGPAALRFEAPAGTTLRVRNVKLRPLGTKAIFNGKDLSGWKEFPGKKSKFTVNDKGELNVKDGPGDLQTEGKWGDFVLQLDCISNGKHLNSGVFFRCRPGEYQNGYEAQIQNDFTKKLPREYTVEEYDPKSHEMTGKKTVASAAADYGTGAIYRRVPARSQAAKDGEWFTMTVVARGGHIATWVNGIQQVDWTDNRPANDNARKGCCLNAGPVSLQGHDKTTDLSFRNLRIVELPPAQK